MPVFQRKWATYASAEIWVNGLCSLAHACAVGAERLWRQVVVRRLLLRLQSAAGEATWPLRRVEVAPTVPPSPAEELRRFYGKSGVGGGEAGWKPPQLTAPHRQGLLLACAGRKRRGACAGLARGEDSGLPGW